VNQLPIDFAPRTAWTLGSRIGAWGWLAALLGLLLSSAGAWHMLSLHDKLSARRHALAVTQQRLDQRVAAPRRANALSISAADAESINRAVRQLNIPWSELLDALEAAASPKVALLEIRPDPASQRLLGLAEARNSGDMIAYVEALKAQPQFSSALLTGHQISEQDRNKPIRFEFVAAWKELPP
jgi:Tfp pilus assembly protein PilN